MRSPAVRLPEQAVKQDHSEAFGVEFVDRGFKPVHAVADHLGPQSTRVCGLRGQRQEGPRLMKRCAPLDTRLLNLSLIRKSGHVCDQRDDQGQRAGEERAEELDSSWATGWG